MLFFFWEEKVRVGDVTPTLLERIWAWRDTLKTKSRSKIRSHTHSLQFTSWFTSYSNRERKRGCHHTNKIMICGKDKKVRYLERIDNMTTLNMHNPTFKRNMISILYFYSSVKNRTIYFSKCINWKYLPSIIQPKRYIVLI